MAIFTVTTLQDTVDDTDGVLSLREALAAANSAEGADTILFGVAGRIKLDAGLGNLSIHSEVTIDGDVAGVGGTRDIVIDGGGATRLFYIGRPSFERVTVDATLRNLVLEGGLAQGGDGGPGYDGRHLAEGNFGTKGGGGLGAGGAVFVASLATARFSGIDFGGATGNAAVGGSAGSGPMGTDTSDSNGGRGSGGYAFNNGDFGRGGRGAINPASTGENGGFGGGGGDGYSRTLVAFGGFGGGSGTGASGGAGLGGSVFVQALGSVVFEGGVSFANGAVSGGLPEPDGGKPGMGFATGVFWQSAVGRIGPATVAFNPGAGETVTVDDTLGGDGAAVSFSKTGDGTMVLNNLGTIPPDAARVHGVILPSLDVINGTLAGLGEIGSLSIAAGATFSPGNEAQPTGGFATGNLTLASGGILALRATGTAAGQFDIVNVTGTVSLAGAVLDFNAVPGATATSQSITIIANDGTDAISGTFASLAEGAKLNAGGRTYAISYIGGDGNDVTLTDAGAATSGPSNSAPVAEAEAYQVSEDGALQVAVDMGLLANDSDAEGNPLAAALVEGPAHGTLTLNPDGSFNYMPDANFSGTDSFAYRASDGQANSDVTTVNLTVTPVNDAPTTAAAAESGSGAEDSVLSGQLLAGSDVEGDALTYVLEGTPAGVTLSASGAWTYTPPADFNGPASFSYRVSDGSLTSAAKTVNLMVTPINDAPVANDDSNLVSEDALERVDGNVLTNDASGDMGDSLTVTSTGSFEGRYGTLKLNADGTYAYTAEADLLDTLTADQQDVFAYTVSDGNGGEDTATLTIDIKLRADNRTTTGTTGHDTLNGDQPASGAGTEDTIRGGSGSDKIYGFAGADDLFGGSGNDLIFGGDGRDDLFGESGADTLDGGAGIDFLDGGSGNDRITGGSEADTFFFASGNGYDTITDFVVGVDKLVIQGITIRSLTSRDVDGDGTSDLIVTFGSGGGNVTLLNAGGRGVTADQLQGIAPEPVASAFLF